MGVTDAYVNLDVVSADILALVGWNVLNFHSLTEDTVMNRLPKNRFMSPKQEVMLQMKNKVHC